MIESLEKCYVLLIYVSNHNGLKKLGQPPLSKVKFRWFSQQAGCKPKIEILNCLPFV
jgi:hypothetical protein